MNTDFDHSVLSPDPARRKDILAWLEAGLAAVDPQPLTAAALDGRIEGPAMLVAIGKAAPAMCRGAAQAVDVVGGVCVSDHLEPIPPELELVLGNHPIPGAQSLDAANKVLDTVHDVDPSTALIALISGGGSTLCEKPREGVSPDYLAQVNRRLLAAGTSIADLNLVRAHLSAIKSGGISRAARRLIDTYVVSDVGGADPGLVASGPTVPRPADPDTAMSIMTAAGIDVPPEVQKAMATGIPPMDSPGVTVVADGLAAVHAIVAVAPSPASVMSEWLTGPVGAAVDGFLAGANNGVTIGVGETVVEHGGEGRGGRNTHAALLAARRLAGTESVFVAFATDGVDGSSGSAGAIVDGGTLSRGGDPAPALADFDSAGYLVRTSDLLRCGATGTNVSDIWILWRPGPSST